MIKQVVQSLSRQFFMKTMGWRNVCVGLWMGLVSPSLVCAQSIGLKEVAHIYKENSQVLNALKEEIKTAENEEMEASRSLLPTVAWFTSVTDQQVSRSIYGSFDFFPNQIFASGFSFNQPIYMGGKVWQAWEVKKQAIQIAKLQYLEQEQNLMSGILGKFLTLYTSIKVRDVLIESQKIQKQFLDLVRERQKRGAARDYELAQAEGNFTSYFSRIQQQEAVVYQLKLDIESELQIEQLEIEKLSVLEPENVQLGSLEGLSTRPDVQLVEKQLVMAEIQKKLAMGDHYPSLNLQGSWGYEARERGEVFDDLSRRHIVTLGLNVPIFSGGSSLYTRRAGEHKITAAKISLKRKLDQAKAELEAARYKLNTAFNAYEANKKWRRQARAALTQGLKSFRLGTIQTFQLVQLQREFEGADLAYWSSLQNFYSDKINGLKVSGRQISTSM